MAEKFFYTIGGDNVKKCICIVLTICLFQIPKIGVAQDGTMIPTATVVDQLSRTEAESKVVEIVNTEEVRTKLESYGITPSEISGRLASLSDDELQQLTTQMEEARYGGNTTVVGVLVVVALVLLIIFLAKRV